MDDSERARVVGVDPGSRFVGLVARRGRVLVDAATLRLGDDETLAAFMTRVRRLIAQFIDTLGGEARIAVETLSGSHKPGPNRGWQNVQTVVDLICEDFPNAELVPNGSEMRMRRDGFPSALRKGAKRPKRLSANECPDGAKRHERSAWAATERLLNPELFDPGSAAFLDRRATLPNRSSDSGEDGSARVEGAVDPHAPERPPLALVPMPPTWLEPAEPRRIDAFPVDATGDRPLATEVDEPADLLNLSTLGVADSSRWTLLDVLQDLELAGARARDQRQAALAERKRALVEQLAAYLGAGGRHRVADGCLIVAEVDMADRGLSWWWRRRPHGQSWQARYRVRWASEHGTAGSEVRFHESELVVVDHEHATSPAGWLATAAVVLAVLAAAGAVVWVVVLPWLAHAWPTLVGGVVLAGTGLSALTRAEH